LKKRGLEKIDVVPGEPFDPGTAEAMTAIDSELPEGTVIEVIEPGYRLYDKVVRAARVIVSKGKIGR
jgi:molecular chaperone GrpE